MRKCLLVLFTLILGPPPAHADPTLTIGSLSGCVRVSDLTGPLVWEKNIAVTAIPWHDPTSGCDPTVFESRSWFDITDSAVTFDPRHAPSCGRFQLDVRNPTLGLYADLVVDTGVSCGGASSTTNTVSISPVAGSILMPATLPMPMSAE